MKIPFNKNPATTQTFNLTEAHVHEALAAEEEGGVCLKPAPVNSTL